MESREHAESVVRVYLGLWLRNPSVWIRKCFWRKWYVGLFSTFETFSRKRFLSAYAPSKCGPSKGWFILRLSPSCKSLGKKVGVQRDGQKVFGKNDFQNSQQLVKQFRHSCDHPGSFRLDLPGVFLAVSCWPNRLEPEILVQCLSFTNERRRNADVVSLPSNTVIWYDITDI